MNVKVIFVSGLCESAAAFAANEQAQYYVVYQDGGGRAAVFTYSEKQAS